VILGGALLVFGIGGASGYAIYKSIKNSEKIEDLDKEVKSLEGKALALKKMTHDEFLLAKDFSLAFEEFKKKVSMKSHNL
jgi:hypothetical protein